MRGGGDPGGWVQDGDQGTVNRQTPQITAVIGHPPASRDLRRGALHGFIDRTLRRALRRSTAAGTSARMGPQGFPEITSSTSAARSRPLQPAVSNRGKAVRFFVCPGQYPEPRPSGGRSMGTRINLAEILVPPFVRCLASMGSGRSIPNAALHTPRRGLPEHQAGRPPRSRAGSSTSFIDFGEGRLSSRPRSRTGRTLISIRFGLHVNFGRTLRGFPIMSARRTTRLCVIDPFTTRADLFARDVEDDTAALQDAGIPEVLPSLQPVIPKSATLTVLAKTVARVSPRHHGTRQGAHLAPPSTRTGGRGPGSRRTRGQVVQIPRSEETNKAGVPPSSNRECAHLPGTRHRRSKANSTPPALVASPVGSGTPTA